MSKFNVQKATSLPSPLVANTIYYVKETVATSIDVFVTDNGSPTVTAFPVSGIKKLFVNPNVSLIGTIPDVTTSGNYTYNYSITSSGYNSLYDLPIGTLIEFEFGMEVNCTVANISGDMDIIISLRLGSYLLLAPISSLLLSTSTTKTIHTTKASFIISAINTFSNQINQKARRDSGPNYDRDRTNLGAPLVGLSGSNITVTIVFGQSNSDNYLKINHGFLKIILP